MSHRRGIVAKASVKEASRRREAKENGIVLEKTQRPKKARDTRRDAGVGAPAVGKFKGGMLRLSTKDVADIEGSRDFAGNRRKTGRR